MPRRAEGDGEMIMTQNPKVSPTPKSKPDRPVDSNEMDFPGAMRAVIDGSKITKLEWENKEIIVWLDGHLKIKLADGTTHDLIVSDGDMIGEDWAIV